MPKRQKILYPILLALSLALPAPACAQTRRLTVSPRNADAMAGTERLKGQLEFLTDTLCQGRGSSTTGSAKAITWIMKRFQDAGLVKFDGSYVRGYTTQAGGGAHNIIGLLPGTGREYVVVGAHFDNLGILGGNMYPGADSNASGVVAMLSLAEMLHYMNTLQHSFQKSVIFVAFDGKHLDMSGSREFWDCVKRGGLVNPLTGDTVTMDKVVLMVNIDQVGGTTAPLKSGREDYLMMLSEEGSPLRGTLANVNSRYGLDFDLAYDYYGSADFTRLFYRRVSDQRVFLESGVPAVMFTSGITMNNNKPYDNVGSLDMDIYRKRILLMYYWLFRIL